MKRLKKIVMTVPFDGEGNLMDYAAPTRPGEIRTNAAHEWRPNYEFDALLTLVGIRKGWSSMKAVWRDADGHLYGMFTSHLGLLLERSGVVRGRAYGRWTFCRKGSNFGIRLADTTPAVHEDVAALAVVMLGGDQAAAAAFVDRATEAIHA